MKRPAVLLVLALAVGFASLANAGKPVRLLGTESLHRVDGLKDGPVQYDLRTRFVEVDAGRLLGEERVELELFDDATVTAVKRRQIDRGPDDYTWFGELENGVGDVVIVVSGEEIAAHVRTEDRGFLVLYAGKGIHTVKEVDLGSFPSNDADGEVPPPSTSPQGSSRPSYNEAASRIDVLIVLSDDVVATFPSLDSARSFARLGVDIMNDGLDRSEVNLRVRALDARYVNYDEPKHSITVRGELTSTDDGVIDEIHQWRDECAADIVSFWVTDFTDPVCGRAYIMDPPSPTFEEFAFNVVDVDCVQFNFTFAHEIGHNMGSRHHISSDPTNTPYRFSHGYQDRSGDFRTIMALSSGCPGACPRINNFSNPDVFYGGEGVDCPGFGCETTGNSSTANNKLSMELTAPYVANFRDSSVGTCGCETSSDCSDGSDCTLDMCLVDIEDPGYGWCRNVNHCGGPDE